MLKFQHFKSEFKKFENLKKNGPLMNTNNILNYSKDKM